METRYYVSEEGEYLGAYCEADPESSEAVEVPTPPSNAAQVWDFVTQAWGSEPSEVVASRVRVARDALLRACDAMALPDYPHADEAARQGWLDYRQALRDVPEQPGFPNTINWPELPE